MSNQDENDQRPILHTLTNTFHQRKCFIFLWYLSVIVLEVHDAVATWPCTFLLWLLEFAVFLCQLVHLFTLMFYELLSAVLQ